LIRWFDAAYDDDEVGTWSKRAKCPDHERGVTAGGNGGSKRKRPLNAANATKER